MVSSIHNLIFACSIALASLLPTVKANGQTNYGQQASTNSVGTQGNETVIIDHSSMSPDSWSAPAIPSVTVTSVASNSMPPYVASTGRPATSDEPSSKASFSASDFKPSNFSPTIPDLNAITRQPSSQIRSLIRQPEIDARQAALPVHPNNAGQSRFQQARYRLGSQAGLSQNNASLNALSNTSLPTFGNQETLPQNIISATGKFDLEPATGSPLVSPTTSAPAASSPVFVQPMLQTGPGRYPLGMNNGLTNTTPTNQPMLINESASNLPATTYNSLTNEAETLFTSPSYSSVEVSDPVVSQPIFQPQQQPLAGLPVFRPDLGHRDPSPTFRGRDHDSGLKMDFEDKKKQFPGLGETLATGRYFGSVGVEYLEAAFQNNSAITQFNSTPDRASFASAESFDFDFETAPRVRFGFESKLGPGVEFDYFQYDQNSDVVSFTSNGLNSGQLSSGLFGPSSLTTLEAVNAGETLAATAGIDLETFSVSFFKEIKFPISRLNGMFGFQYASIFQTLEGQLTDAGGNVIGSLRSTSDLRAYGPKFRLEYYRPIGHTKLEFITKVGGGVLFGNRDQIISNTGLPAVNRFSSNELAVTGDFYGGVQYKQNTAENRGYYIRLGTTHQTWIGGGTAVNAQENFGLRGFVFEVGINR